MGRGLQRFDRPWSKLRVSLVRRPAEHEHKHGANPEKIPGGKSALIFGIVEQTASHLPVCGVEWIRLTVFSKARNLVSSWFSFG